VLGADAIDRAALYSPRGIATDLRSALCRMHPMPCGDSVETCLAKSEHEKDP